MTSSRAAALAVIFACAIPGTAWAQRSAQDIESARQLYNQGITLRDQGDMKGALEKFRAAHALGNTPITGIELCRTYATMKMPVEAREICLGVARIPPLPQETQRSQDARNEATKIAEAEKPKIGAVRLKLTGVPAGAEPLVLIDGAAIPPAALTEWRAVDPGSHVITAKIGDGPESRATVDTHEGESRDVELAVVAPATPIAPSNGAASSTQPPENVEKKNTFATVAFGVGAVAAAVGIVGGVKAISGESDLDGKCIAKQCGLELHDDLDSAKTWGTVATVGFVIAGVALGAGFVSTFMAKSGPNSAKSASSSSPPSTARITPVIGLGGAGLRGSF